MIRIKPRLVTIIAGKEFWDRIRSRWVLAAAAIFTLFALVIAYFGSAQAGAVGFKGMDLTIASLVSLVIYLVPLISLILGYDALVGERERGSLDLLLTMPITRLELILGKYLGLGAALACSTIAGFGLAGIVLSYGIGVTALLHYASFILTTLLLGLAFLSLALLLSVYCTSKVAASGIAIALWFFYVLVYDLLLVGMLVVVGGGGYVGRIFPLLMLLNPADIFRILNVYNLEEVRSLYGLATVMPETLASYWALGLGLVCWIVIPLVIAYKHFRDT
jgi:Cu-processing system permease protein